MYPFIARFAPIEPGGCAMRGDFTPVIFVMCWAMSPWNDEAVMLTLTPPCSPFDRDWDNRESSRFLANTSVSEMTCFVIRV
jgi:hypothetical protein